MNFFRGSGDICHGSSTSFQNPCQPLVGQLAHADSLSPSAAAARQLPLGDSMRLKVHDAVSLDGKSATCDMAHLTRTGSHVDAKNDTHYVATYMGKDSRAMAETASAFFLAQKHVKDHESTAPDCTGVDGAPNDCGVAAIAGDDA